MKQEQLIEKIFKRSENPVQSVEDLGNLCPFLFATPQSREVFNTALRKHGYEINENYFQENDQITMMAHPSCGSSSDDYGYGGGHPSCGSSRGWGYGGGHPSCGSSNNRGNGGGHPSCGSSFSSKKPYAKMILPVNKEAGSQSGIRC